MSNPTIDQDGPAIKYANGDKYWYLNGELHRVNGPAIEKVDGNKEWYQYNIKIKHNICNKCKIKCHNESKLVNKPK